MSEPKHFSSCDGTNGYVDELCNRAEAAADGDLLSALRELESKWRKEAAQHKQYGDCYRVGQGWGMDECADDLALLLRHEGGEEP